MTSTTILTRIAATLPRLSLRSILDRLVEADRRHRENHKLHQLSDEHLADMNFYRQHGEIRRGGF